MGTEDENPQVEGRVEVKIESVEIGRRTQRIRRDHSHLDDN